MKRTEVLMIVLALLILTLPVQAQNTTPKDMLPPDLEKSINLEIDQLLPVLSTVQTNHYHQHHRYWQGLRNPATIPHDGALALYDGEQANKPTDQMEAWNIVTLKATTMLAYTVNVYDGPQGQGYELVAEIIVNGQCWRRVINVGPESYREQSWEPIIEEDLH